MKKRTSIVVIILVILAAGAFLLMKNNNTFSITPSQDIFCNDFNFVCCVENPIATSINVNNNYLFCPGSATKCILENVVPGTITFHNDGSVAECLSAPTKDFLGNWICSSYQKKCNGPTCMIDPGSYDIVYTSATWKTYSQRLDDCGRAGCTQGVPVLGAQGCSFVTDKSVYDSTGALKKMPASGSVATTVPYGVCYLYTTYSLRRVCGSTGEQCTANSDCTSKYPYTYAYNGQTYGATCQSGTLQLYGCHQEAGCLEYDVIFGQQKCVNPSTKSYCAQITGIQVQCCPGSDICGSNSVCDPKTFTCSQTAQCTNDYDCGTMITCDRAAKTLKQPKCILGQCQQTTLQSVGCCYDTDCASGYYCSSDRQCVQKIDTKTDCPFSCCKNEANYFDKNCAGDTPVCCGDHTCSASAGSCGTPPIPPSLPWDIIFGALAASVAFFVVGGKSIKQRDEVGIALAAVIATIAFIVTWWVVNNWQMIALSLGIAALLGGIGLYFFGGVLITIFFVLSTLIRTAKGV